MEKYDIKHPLRGQKFDDPSFYKQSFERKIQEIMDVKNGFVNFKKDFRQLLDYSKIQSDDYLQQ